MNTSPPTTDSDLFERALGATRQQLRRHALWQFVLYAWFATVSLGAAGFVAWLLAERGAVLLATAWPALLAQLAAAALLLLVLRNQMLRVRAFRQRALPVREAAQLQRAELRRQRRQSTLLLAAAAVVTPMLLVAVAQLGTTAALADGQGWQLALLVVVPALVIAGVHGSRLLRMGREQRQLEAAIAALDGIRREPATSR